MDKNFNANDVLAFADDVNHEKHGLRGHVQVFKEDMKTGKVSLWDESDNIIPISGYQFVLTKMFGLYLDSPHNKPNKVYENIGKDTNLVIPDLNNSDQLAIGTDPLNYSGMVDDISSDYFVKGFMIGNGGAGEDNITTKNSDYSFTKLRNPIPFQQTNGSAPLDSSIAGQYLGGLRGSSSNKFPTAYYIKKFDETPHIYHTWWRDDQKWDYIDPVTKNDLGPNPKSGVGKTNRIATYAECKLSISDSDCIAYYNKTGNTETAVVNELGLVCFDTTYGTRSIAEMTYNKLIKQLIMLVFDNKDTTAERDAKVIALAKDIMVVLNDNDTFDITSYGQTNINACMNVIETISTSTEGNVPYSACMTELVKDTNIGVEALYNQDGTLVSTKDTFLTNLSDTAFATLTTDEAERIRLVTYYPFKTIALESNIRWLINYRIYAN